MRAGHGYVGVALVYWCHDGTGNAVLAKRTAACRDEAGRWDIGGGGLEFGERLEERLRQEVREEYCAAILATEFLGYRDVHRTHDGRPTHWVALDFKVLVDAATVRNGEPHKFEEVRFFSKDTLPSPLHSQLPGFLVKYGHRL